MCDTLIKRNLNKKEIPQYVYKRVQKVGNGKYITPVMGETLYKGSWKGGKSYNNPGWNIFATKLVNSLKTKFTKSAYANSSKWTEHHVGRWTSFKYLKDAVEADLVSNFISDMGRFPTFVVKCEIRGEVSSALFSAADTYLSTQIRVVEEVKEILN